jgi:signal transduction histidine kinase
MTGPQVERYPWWRGLRALAVGWTILPLTLMLILAVGATAIALQATVKVFAENHNRDRVSLAAGQLSSELEKYVLSFQALADQPDLANLNPEQAQATFEQYHYWLLDFVNSGGVTALNAEGVAVATYPHRPELLGQSHAGQPYFQPQASYAPTFFDITAEPGTGQKMTGLSVPLIDDAGEFSGMLVGRFYLDFQQQFGRFIWPLQEVSGGQAYLVDRKGQVIFHTNPDMVGQDFGDRQAIVRLRGEGQPGVFTQQSQGASREVVAYAPLSEAGWGLVVSVPWSQVVQPVQYALTFIALALVLGLLGLTLIVFWAVNRINQPLERLVQQVRRVTAGDYDSQVSLSQIREIRALGLAFNYMVSQMKSYRSGLQEYVASVTDTQEEERKRIARDLHDGTVQSLIAIGQRIELSRDTLGEQPVELSKTQLTELRNMVTETIASVRQFSRDLRPLALEDLGLIPALQFLVNRLTQEEGMSAELQIEGEAAGLSPDLETTVYRLIQEALSNIRKHAQASEVLVTVRFLPRQTILEIQDNGVGFAVPQSTTDLARTGSFGLLGMEERAHLFGGDISIQSAINQGSIIRVILPHTQLPRRR